MVSSPRYDKELLEFLEPPVAGRLVMLSDDPLFVRALRTTVYKTLAVKTDCLDIHQDPAQALSAVGQLLSRKVPVLVLADRFLRGQHTLEFVRSVKTGMTAAKILVMTQETTKEQLSLLYELGVDSVLTKPVSIDTLIEKMAGAIKPQGRVSRLVVQARTLLEQGDAAGVMQIGQSILEIKGSSAVAHMLMGDALMCEGRRDEALKEYEAAHSSAKLYLEPIKKMAEAHKDGDEDAYLRCLRKLDAISPLNPGRKCDIGKIYVRRNDVEQADRYFSAAIETTYEEALGSVERLVADIVENLGEMAPALAEKYCVRLLDLKGDKLSPADMVTFNRLGIALRRQGKWREAVENYEKALTVVPSDSRVLYNLGLAYADGQMHRKAVGIFAKVLRNDPNFHKSSAMVASNMAKVYLQAKDMEMVRTLAGDALAAEPGHAPALWLLAKLDGKG